MGEKKGNFLKMHNRYFLGSISAIIFSSAVIFVSIVVYSLSLENGGSASDPFLVVEKEDPIILKYEDGMSSSDEKLCRADLNYDCIVDDTDLNLFDQNEKYRNSWYDLDLNGVVSGEDRAIITENSGTEVFDCLDTIQSVEMREDVYRCTGSDFQLSRGYNSQVKGETPRNAYYNLDS